MSEPRAGLYLHVPFCARICPYCDFAVRTGDRERRRRFADALVAEIALHESSLRFDTIYFGGGTPSCLDVADLEHIVDAVRGRFALEPGTRIFFEANPEDVTAERIAAWRRLGVTTLSLGVQALAAPALAFLGRGHGVEDAQRAVALALDAGFETVSVDLIYGLPGQTNEDWRDELDRALALGVDHLSCYQLTIHEGTRFGLLARRGLLVEADEDRQGDFFRLTHRHLAAHGMQGYEASQFARSPEHRSRHNVKYWDHTPYLGLGPSAHSYSDRRRWWNLRHSEAWEAAIAAGRLPIEADERLDPRELALEALMTGLRTYDGVDLSRVYERFGVDLFPANRKLIEQLVDRDLVTCDRTRLVPTLEGLAIADGLVRAFDIPLADSARGAA